MPKFSQHSLEKLESADPRLQAIFKEVIKYVDCVILEGHRGEKEQNAAFERGNSKVKWPNSAHNKKPSMAVDVAPYPVDWADEKNFYYFAGIVKGIAISMGYDKIISWALGKKHKWDLPHYEIKE